MKKLSTGQDSTLGNYKSLCSSFFGDDSPSLKWVNEKISKSRQGENEEIIADEEQMLAFFARVNKTDI